MMENRCPFYANPHCGLDHFHDPEEGSLFPVYDCKCIPGMRKQNACQDEAQRQKVNKEPETFYCGGLNPDKCSYQNNGRCLSTRIEECPYVRDTHDRTGKPDRRERKQPGFTNETMRHGNYYPSCDRRSSRGRRAGD